MALLEEIKCTRGTERIFFLSKWCLIFSRRRKFPLRGYRTYILYMYIYIGVVFVYDSYYYILAIFVSQNVLYMYRENDPRRERFSGAVVSFPATVIVTLIIYIYSPRSRPIQSFPLIFVYVIKRAIWGIIYIWIGALCTRPGRGFQNVFFPVDTRVS